jgi:hypothetical protein
MRKNVNNKGARNNARDITHELSHRVKAGAERAKRDVFGDVMTAGQKLKSGVKEAGHRVAAEVERAKRRGP